MQPFPNACYRGAHYYAVGYMVFLKVLMPNIDLYVALQRKSPELGDHAACSKELTPTRLHVLSPRCHDYRASDPTFLHFMHTEAPRAHTHSRGFSLRSIRVLASAHEPVRQLIETCLKLLRGGLRHRRAATNLTQLVVNHAVRLARANRPGRHVLRQLVA